MKILVIQQKRVGDVLTSSILFEILRNNYPYAELHYLIYPHTRAVVDQNPFIDEIIEYDPKCHTNPVKFFRFLKNIESRTYDVVIDPYSKISSGIIAKYSGATIRPGFHKKYTQQFYTHTFKYKNHPESKAGLAIENRLLLIKALCHGTPIEFKPVIYLSNREKIEIKTKLAKEGLNMDLPLIMCGVLGSSESKSYPLKYMARVLDEIHLQKKEAQILFNYLPSQEQQAQEVYNYCSESTRSRIYKNIYEKELRGFILNCASCDIFIGNEGGAANIAKALNVPTFSIYSPLIRKVDWAIYEDGIKNKSVHPEDFSSSTISYENLKPEYFKSDLKDFLQENILNKPLKPC